MRRAILRHRVPLVAALGVTQIIGYGSIYYAFPVLAPEVAAEFGVFVAVLSAAAILGAIMVLLLPGPPSLLAFVFAAVLGAGAGLSSIVRGAVPVALFGASGLGRRLGRLAAIRNLLGAAAPFLFALAAAQSMAWALGAALVLALAGLGALHRALARTGVVPPFRSRPVRDSIPA